MARNVALTDEANTGERSSPQSRRRARRRQTAIEVLVDRHRPTSVRELATALSGWGAGSGDSGDATDRLRTALHHADLPALDDAGLVEYDPDRNAATLSVDLPQRHR